MNRNKSMAQGIGQKSQDLEDFEELEKIEPMPPQEHGMLFYYGFMLGRFIQKNGTGRDLKNFAEIAKKYTVRKK